MRRAPHDRGNGHHRRRLALHRFPTATQARKTRDILFTAARDTATAGVLLGELSEPEIDDLLRAGTAQGLGTVLVASLHAARLPVPAWLEAHRFNSSVHRTNLMHAVGSVGPALSEAGIPWVVLKGPLVAASSQAPELREFKDLDLLVPGHSLAAAVSVLEAIGVDSMNRNWDAYVRHGVAEFPIHTLGAPLDLHWHLIGLEAIRRRFRIPMVELLDRRTEIVVNGVGLQSLDGEDTVMHVALHAGLSGATRASWLRDVHLVVTGLDIDWREFVARARRYRVSSVVGHVLDRSRCLVGTDVPDEVPEQLAPVRALRVRRALDAGPPPARGRSDELLSGFLVGTSRAGMIETAGRATELMQDRVMTWRGRPPRWSAYDPEGPLYWARASGGSDGLQQYLAFAARASEEQGGL